MSTLVEWMARRFEWKIAELITSDDHLFSALGVSKFSEELHIRYSHLEETAQKEALYCFSSLAGNHKYEKICMKKIPGSTHQERCNANFEINDWYSAFRAESSTEDKGLISRSVPELSEFCFENPSTGRGYITVTSTRNDDVDKSILAAFVPTSALDFYIREFYIFHLLHTCIVSVLFIVPHSCALKALFLL
jgi:hypothetical protein